MNNELTSQILFDSQASFSPVHMCMLIDFDMLRLKHEVTVRKGIFDDEYYEGLRGIAERYDVEYVMPRYRSGLKGVDISSTVH